MQVHQGPWHKASNLKGRQNLKEKKTCTDGPVNKCHFFVGKSLEFNYFVVNYTLSISKCLVVSG